MTDNPGQMLSGFHHACHLPSQRLSFPFVTPLRWQKVQTPIRGGLPSTAPWAQGPGGMQSRSQDTCARGPWEYLA